MDLQTLAAQWSGKVPDGFVPPAVVRHEPPQCVQPRCRQPASLKANGEYARSCESCRIRRAKSCKRRRAALVAEGGCRRSAGTPSTRPPSTSSRPGPTRRTARATSTWAFRSGTRARRGNPPQPTGRRCRTPCRSRSANGSSLRGIRVAASAAADPSTPGRAAVHDRVSRPVFRPRARFLRAASRTTIDRCNMGSAVPEFRRDRLPRLGVDPPSRPLQRTLARPARRRRLPPG